MKIKDYTKRAEELLAKAIELRSGKVAEGYTHDKLDIHEYDMIPLIGAGGKFIKINQLQAGSDESYLHLIHYKDHNFVAVTHKHIKIKIY